MNAPIECEKKFLIRMPSISLLREQKGVSESEIVQTYLASPSGITARVRARTEKGKTAYTYTEKIRISAYSAIENEKTVTKEEYDALLLRADPNRNAICKTRFAFPFENHVIEIDLYPFWSKTAVLEVELKNENEGFDLPNFIVPIREVSREKEYKNAFLALKIPPDPAE